MIDSSKYKKLFIEESLENLGSINDTLAVFEENMDDQEAMNALFRAFHSIKGMAASMNYRQVQKLSHKLEDMLDGLRSGKCKCSEEVIDIIYDGAVLLEKMVYLIEDDSDTKEDPASLLQRIARFISSQTASLKMPPASQTEADSEDELAQKDLAEVADSGKDHYQVSITISEKSTSPPARAYLVIESLKTKSSVLKTLPPLSDIECGKMGLEFQIFFGTDFDQGEVESLLNSSLEIERYEFKKIEVAQAQRDGDPSKVLSRTAPSKNKEDVIRFRKPGAVKVETPVLDSLIDIVGEMFIHENQLAEIAQSLGSKETTKSANGLEKLVRKLYKEVMNLRLEPISILTDIIPRVLREVLKDKDKKVEVEVKGKEIKLDRSIIEKLGDPLIHLIRNSLDHGIESTSERLRLNKPEKGKLTFSAAREKDFIVIELKDDGRGLDINRIKEIVITREIASPEVLEEKELEEIYNYIWHPGFSTASQVTSVSGRGVGMDIVKNAVEGLGGKAQVFSTPGEGCTFRLQVPLTMAIIKTFRIKLDNDIYAIPIRKVIRTMEIQKDQLKKDSEGLHIYYKEEKIKVKNLRDMLQYESNGFGTRQVIPVLMVQGNHETVGLMVDEFQASYETVIKPLGAPLKKLEILSGGTMSEKGEIILTLDVDKLIEVPCGINTEPLS